MPRWDLRFDCSWRPPHPRLVAWMEGRIHHRPPGRDFQEDRYADRKRSAAFVLACRTADPTLAVWPEFTQELLKLGLTRAYEKGTISQEVAGLLIVQQNRSIGPWLARSARMLRNGKDPLQRRRYCRSQRQLYQVIMQARRLAELRRFEGEAIRAMAVE